MPSATDASSYGIYSRVVREGIRNVFMMIVGAAFAYWFVGKWLLGSKILFWLFLLITVMEGIQIASTLKLGATASKEAKKNGVDPQTIIWLHRAGYVRIISLFIAITLLAILYLKIW